MSDEPKVTINLGKLALLVAVCSGLAGLGAAVFLIPHRLAKVENQVEKLSELQRVDHEMLSRIDERTKRLWNGAGDSGHVPQSGRVKTAAPLLKTPYNESYEVVSNP